MCQEHGGDAGSEKATIAQEYDRLCADVELYKELLRHDKGYKDRRP
jgi:hypothetical protein